MKSRKKTSRYKSRRRRRHLHWVFITIPIVVGVAGVLITTHIVSLPESIQELPTKVLKTTGLKKLTVKSSSQHFTTVSGEKVIMKTTTLGKTYLISETTKKKLTGLQTIGKKEYYFSPENSEMVYGFKKIDGYYYYFDDDGVNDTVKAYKKLLPRLRVIIRLLKKLFQVV